LSGAERDYALERAKARIEEREAKKISKGQAPVFPEKVDEAWKRIDAFRLADLEAIEKRSEESLPVSVALTPSVAPLASLEQTIIPILLKLTVEIDIRVKSQVG
jgi:hypothetical protein